MMTLMDALRAEVRQFVIDNFLYGQPAELRDDNQPFLDTGIIDSTGVLELVAFLESKYGIKIEDQELLPDNLDSVAKVCAFVERKRVATQGAGSRV